MDAKKLLEMMSDSPKMNLPEGKDKAIKDVLLALKELSGSMMADDLKQHSEEDPAVVGVKVTKMAAPAADAEPDMCDPNELGEPDENADVEKLKMILKNKEEMKK